MLVAKLSDTRQYREGNLVMWVMMMMKWGLLLRNINIITYIV
jgi:hypothetical protein